MSIPPPAAHRSFRRSRAALLLGLALLGAGAGCGASAGAACDTDDDCAAGLTCRGGVCLPTDAGDAALDAETPDGEPEARDGDEAEVDGADAPPEVDVPGDGDDAEVDGGPPPVLVSLAPGEVWDPAEPLAPHGVRGEAGESYVLVLWEDGLRLWSSFELGITLENGRKSRDLRVPLGEPPRPARTPCFPLLARDAAAVPLPPLGRGPFRDPLPGDTAPFNVVNPDGASVSEITARLEHLDDDVEIWADQTNPFASPGATFYDDVAALVRDVILPREVWLFAEPPDVDGNGRIVLLLSPTVGESGASGYVNPYDLTTSSLGNRKDMIYLNPPNDWYGPEWKVMSTCGVLSHELQHLIRAGAVGVEIDESPYLNEGMSHLAADLAGFGFDNLWFLPEFLGEPSFFTVPRGIDAGGMAYAGDYRQDVSLRSAGYLLLRYLFDRLGGLGYEAGGGLTDRGGRALLREQFSSSRRGVELVEELAGLPRSEFIPDWLTAMLLDGRLGSDGTPLDNPPRFRLADPFDDPITGAQHGVALNADNAYLDIGSVFLPNASPTDLRDWTGTLLSGGVALLLVRPELSGPVVARFTFDDDEPPVLGARWVRLP